LQGFKIKTPSSLSLFEKSIIIERTMHSISRIARKALNIIFHTKEEEEVQTKAGKELAKSIYEFHNNEL
jgi:hypothetical protein